MQAVLCVWLATFNTRIAATIDGKSTHLVAAITQTVKSAKKDKVIRVCLGALRVCAVLEPCRHFL
jgi:hypothetical protein